MIPIDELSGKDTIFTHVEGDVQTMIAVGRLMQWIEKTKPEVFEVEIEPDFAKYCVVRRGIEQHRLDRITKSDLRKYPIIYLQWPNKSFMICDGYHRYVRASMLGRKWIRSYVLTEEEWRPFEVDTGNKKVTQDALLTMFSGIP